MSRSRGPSSADGHARSGRVAEDISIGGIVSGLRPLKTRKGDRMCVFTLDDAAGSIEVVVFPEAFKQYGHLAENGRMVLVHGRFERDDESARLLASEIAPIEMVRERLAKSVAIRLSMPPHGRATFERLLGRARAAQGRSACGVRHPRAGPPPARDGRCQRHARPPVGAAGVRGREDLWSWLGQSEVIPCPVRRSVDLPCHRDER